MKSIAIYSILFYKIVFCESSKCENNNNTIFFNPERSTIISNNSIPDNRVVLKCLRRCCADGEVLNLTTKNCIRSRQSDSFPQYRVSSIINVPQNEICKKNEMRTRLKNFTLDSDSVLSWMDLNKSVNDYCLVNSSDNITYAIICSEMQIKTTALTYTGKISIFKKYRYSIIVTRKLTN